MKEDLAKKRNIMVDRGNSDINVPFDFEGNYTVGSFGSALDVWNGLEKINNNKNGKLVKCN